MSLSSDRSNSPLIDFEEVLARSARSSMLMSGLVSDITLPSNRHASSAWVPSSSIVHACFVSVFSVALPVADSAARDDVPYRTVSDCCVDLTKIPSPYVRSLLLKHKVPMHCRGIAMFDSSI